MTNEVHDARDGKWLVLAAVSLGAFLSTLNITIVNVPLPSIARDFSVGVDGAHLVVLGYLLALGTLLLAFGRLGDIIGYRQVYAGGFALFAFASGLCGLAGGVFDLSAFGFLQGTARGCCRQSVPPS